MEELRPFLADRLVLSLINLRKVQKKGFKQSDSGAVLMSDETRKGVLVAYQTRKQEEITVKIVNGVKLASFRLQSC
jgi:CRISPR-associated protein Cas1